MILRNSGMLVVKLQVLDVPFLKLSGSFSV